MAYKKGKTKNSLTHTRLALKNWVGPLDLISVFAILAVVVFFTNLGLFLYEHNLSPISPSLYIFIFTALAILLTITSKVNIHVLQSPLILWTYGFILTSFIWYNFSSKTETQFFIMEQRIIAVILITIMLLLFSTEQSQLWAKRAFFLAVLFSVSMNIYEATFPSLLWSEWLGRSAGLYINPNISGIACVLGMILSITVLNKKYRIFFAFFVGIGVLATFSQGALIVWFISVVLMIFLKTISLKINFFEVSSVAIIVFIIAAVSYNNIAQLFEDDTGQKHLRWEKIIFNTYQSGDSRESRLEVAEAAWASFSENPLTGNGIGSSDQTQGSHNIYLSYAAEQGILGFFIFPMFAISIVWSATGVIRKDAIVFFVILLLWGFASHNVLEERYILISCSFMSACIMSDRFKRTLASQNLYTSPEFRPDG